MNPFHEGMQAQSHGVPPEACPYFDQSDDRKSWLKGWIDSKIRTNKDDMELILKVLQEVQGHASLPNVTNETVKEAVNKAAAICQQLA